MEFTSPDFSMILIICLLLLWPVSTEENERPLRAMLDFVGISDSINSGNPQTYISRLPLNRGSKKSFHGEEEDGEDEGRPYKPEENWSNAAYEHPNVYGQRWGIQYGAHQKPVVVIVPDKSL